MSKGKSRFGYAFDYIYLTIWSWLDIRGDTEIERELTTGIVFSIPLLGFIGASIGQIESVADSLLSNRVIGSAVLGLPVVFVVAYLGYLRSRTCSSSERFRLLSESSSKLMRTCGVLLYFSSPIVFLVWVRS